MISKLYKGTEVHPGQIWEVMSSRSPLPKRVFWRIEHFNSDEGWMAVTVPEENLCQALDWKSPTKPISIMLGKRLDAYDWKLVAGSYTPIFYLG